MRETTEVLAWSSPAPPSPEVSTATVRLKKHVGDEKTGQPSLFSQLFSPPFSLDNALPGWGCPAGLLLGLPRQDGAQLLSCLQGESGLHWGPSCSDWAWSLSPSPAHGLSWPERLHLYLRLGAAGLRPGARGGTASRWSEDGIRPGPTATLLLSGALQKGNCWNPTASLRALSSGELETTQVAPLPPFFLVAEVWEGISALSPTPLKAA